jgi:hypothetical protein
MGRPSVLGRQNRRRIRSPARSPKILAGAGIGEYLLEWVDRQIKTRGRDYMCLDVIYENAKLRRYYEQLGFELIGEVYGERAHPTGASTNPWRAALYKRRCCSL